MKRLAKANYENRLPILIIGLIGLILCFMGALQMRQLRKQGFILWLIGEILPIIGAGLFLGLIAFKGIFLIFYLFPAIFIILYTVYKKELIY